MAGRLDSLEKQFALLATKLQQQEKRNSELETALSQEEQQRTNEKTAFASAVGVLQGAIAQLSNRVNVMPKLLDQEKRNKYKHSLSSSINSMSEKIGELGRKLAKTTETQIQVRDTRSQTAGELLGKLLGKDLENALEGMTSKNNKDSTGEGKGALSPLGSIAPASAAPVSVAPASVAPASSVIATNSQPLIPMDLLPESHLTSLSTPNGQGPAGSASTNPILPNFSYVQVPSQTNVAAPSTPTGSGPVGSASSMPIAGQPIAGQQIAAEPLKTVSLTSVASKFKPPVNVAGYNVLPLAPATAIQPETLEPPGTITAQPGLPSLVGPDQVVPGAVSPYEILTSSQMLPKVVPPVGFNGLPPLPASNSQAGSPYEVLTTSQLTQPGRSVTKGKVLQTNNSNNYIGKKGKIKQLVEKEKATKNQAGRAKVKKVTNRAPKELLKAGKKLKARIKKMKNSDSKEIIAKSAYDPLGAELKKVFKLGDLKEVENPTGASMKTTKK